MHFPNTGVKIRTRSPSKLRSYTFVGRTANGMLAQELRFLETISAGCSVVTWPSALEYPAVPLFFSLPTSHLILLYHRPSLNSPRLNKSTRRKGWGYYCYFYILIHDNSNISSGEFTENGIYIKLSNTEVLDFMSKLK